MSKTMTLLEKKALLLQKKKALLDLSEKGIDLEGSIEEYEETHKLEFFKPYDYQQAIFDNFRSGKKIGVMPLSNKVGKCVTYQTLIDTPFGEKTVGELFEKGESFLVYAWDGEKKVVAQASAPFRKEGLHECYRINMQNGSFIEVADHHKILTSSGQYAHAEHLLKSYVCRPQSNSGFYPLVHGANDLNSYGKQSDCQDHYSVCSRQYDEQPLSCRDNGQVLTPSQDDAQQLVSVSCNSDGQEHKCTNIQKATYDLPSNLYDHHHLSGQSSASLSQGICTPLSQEECRLPVALQPSIAESSGLQSYRAIEPQFCDNTSQLAPSDIDLSAYEALLIDSSNNIIDYTPIGKQEVYDFEVQRYHNYCAGGLVHHNTFSSAALIISWALGYEPWNPCDKNDPMAFRTPHGCFKRSCLGKKPPVRIRITGEDWEKHIAEVIVPELKKWTIPEEWTVRKNNIGVEASWKHKNGSTLDIMTYKQPIEQFEGWLGDAWWPDEPPPKDIWAAMSRGLFMSGGKVFMSMTPLKEAWIYNELIKSSRPDIFVIKGVTLWECPHLIDFDRALLLRCGLSMKQTDEFFRMQKEEARLTKELPECEKKLKEWLKDSRIEITDDFGQVREDFASNHALQELRIHRFIKDLEDDTERIPRVFGEPKHLMGTVWKHFDPHVHVVKDFKVPPDWPVMFQIDFHLGERHAIMFCAVDPNQRYFVVDEIWKPDMTNSAIVDEIARRKIANTWRMNYGEVDAIAKGDDKYVKNVSGGQMENSFSVLTRGLLKHGIRLGIGSKDENSYVAAIEERMKGPNGMPTIFIQAHCKETIAQVRDWVRDKNGKPKDDGHFGECLGRVAMYGLRYTDPSEFSRDLPYAKVAV